MMSDDRPPLSELTAVQLRARAQEYRDMAATARTVGTAAALHRLAEIFDGYAAEQDNRGGEHQKG